MIKINIGIKSILQPAPAKKKPGVENTPARIAGLFPNSRAFRFCYIRTRHVGTALLQF
jgi:hypothetical protein